MSSWHHPADRQPSRHSALGLMGLVEKFTTKDMPAVQRLEFWNSVASGFSPGLAISGVGENFNGNLRCLELDSVKLLWAMASASEVSRLPATCGDERIVIHVQNVGLCRQNQYTHDITLAPGDISLCTTAAPFLQIAADHEIFVLDVERSVLEGYVPDLDDRLGKLVPATVHGVHSFHQLLLAFWREMTAAPHDAPAAMLHGTERVLLDLLGLALNSREPAVSPRTDSRLVKVNQVIDRHIGESVLSPSFVADQLGVSLRTMQLWFAAWGTTPRAHIQRRRVELASTALRRGGPSITAIAMDHGFSDSAHFARCFHKHYGQYPRAYRNADRGIRLD